MHKLATELVELIGHQLGDGDLARLLICSRKLHQVLEPMLYSSTRQKDLAMESGCTRGNLSMIRKAVVYGAAASVVQASTSAAPRLTLFLAAKSGHAKAFHLLVEELGAGLGSAAEMIHDTVIPPGQDPFPGQIRKVMACVARPEMLGCLQLLLDRGLDGRISQLHGPQVAQPLAIAIHSGAPLSLAALLVGHGADPNLLTQKTARARWTYTTPLSAAVETGSLALVDGLVRLGAVPDWRPGRCAVVCVEPTHYPLYAAIKALASACNSNNNNPINTPSGPTSSSSTSGDSPQRQSPGRGGLGLNSRALADVQFLVEDLGADLTRNPHEMPPNLERHLKSKHWIPDGTPGYVEMLLDRCGVHQLAKDPGFAQLVEYIIKNGGAVSRGDKLGIKRMFRKHDLERDREPGGNVARCQEGRNGAHGSEVLEAWKRCKALLLNYVSVDPHDYCIFND
ncbi:hypothetical protein Micbo1qcDRAFT_218234 [Microdochium bolleyi]|uniref:Uncharacterized protein n=1 Tax=Microdochium bolleyi TaxID=196109 RepID=A0A136IQ38_9PEZI|nr:hypothetical protein Micbo1qcDRAFT_218234 [Microdochium bolleyi]